MRSIAVDYSTRKLVERSIAEPVIGGPSDVLFQIREVGVCGTDREIAACRLGVPPARDQFLVLGHEALGQVIETGAEVKELAAGDWVVPAIRRSCAALCPSCARNRRDLCLSGDIEHKRLNDAGSGRHQQNEEVESMAPPPWTLLERSRRKNASIRTDSSSSASAA